jgi:glycosyltransferase involved in cell wall biosynthesis
MKVAFIGNMNNNNFALLRYFRDMGIDAHLLLWRNDGRGSLAHFTPDHDAWDPEKWAPYIHRMDISNAYPSVLFDLRRFRPAPSRVYLSRIFEGYDVLIGSGLAPAVVRRAGRVLDIFYPYGAGIEFVGCIEELGRINSLNPFKRWLYRRLRTLQIKGILDAKYCLNAEMGLSRRSFEAMGKEFLPLAIPMVYSGMLGDGVFPSSRRLEDIRERIEGSSFSCLSHASQTWWNDGTYSAKEWAKQSKNNHWLIQGFANFVRSSHVRNGLLVLLEYGNDVSRAKKLVADLGISDQVIWLPKMARKELVYLISLCDAGVGEFVTEPGCLWSGTGWEVLAVGKPLLQSFNFSPAEFERMFGHPPPPLLDVKSPEDVAARLSEIYVDPEKSRKLGEASRVWFDRYNGLSLARMWLELLIPGKQVVTGGRGENAHVV